MTINGQTQIYIATNANTTTDFVKSLKKNIYAEDGDYIYNNEIHACIHFVSK